MARKSAFCIVLTRAQANRIIERLKIAHFSSSDISALFADQAGSHNWTLEKQPDTSHGTVAGASTGGVIGGALGWIAGVGTFAMPGMGSLVAAGPIMTALSDSGIAASDGGVARGLIGLGLPESEAKRYEHQIKEGSILISVHTESAAEISRAKEIFAHVGAQDIVNTGDPSLPIANATAQRPPNPGSNLHSNYP